MQPFLLYMQPTPAPNPWKVFMVLEELGLPYQCVVVNMKEMHTPAYEVTNPNGRIPALVDPNQSNLTVWESGAILEYLMEQYDPTHKLHAPSSDLTKRFAEKQLLHFQMSGQGPYFGQFAWFTLYHPEPVESARTRYLNEIDRVTGVVDAILKKNGSDAPYLTGAEVSYVDFAWLPWYWGAANERFDVNKVGIFKNLTTKYPSFAKWFETMNERASAKKARSALVDADVIRPALDVTLKEIPADVPLR